MGFESPQSLQLMSFFSEDVEKRGDDVACQGRISFVFHVGLPFRNGFRVWRVGWGFLMCLKANNVLWEFINDNSLFR